MIDRHQAEQIAEALIQKESQGSSYPIVIHREATIEKDYGWIFFYNTEAFLQSEDFDFALVGNVPFVVERATGAVHFLSTSPFFDIALANYEEGLRRSGTDA
jgi:hypothetical protein